MAICGLEKLVENAFEMRYNVLEEGMDFFICSYNCRELYRDLEILRYLIDKNMKFPISAEDEEPFLITFILTWKLLEFLFSAQPPKREFLEDLFSCFEIYLKLLSTGVDEKNDTILGRKREFILKDSAFASLFGIIKTNRVDLNLTDPVFEFKKFLENERKVRNINLTPSSVNYHKEKLFNLTKQLTEQKLYFRRRLELYNMLSASFENTEFLQLSDQDLINFFRSFLEASYKTKQKPKDILTPAAYKILVNYMKHLVNFKEFNYNLIFETLGTVVQKNITSSPIQKVVESGDWSSVINAIPQNPFYVTYDISLVSTEIISGIHLELSEFQRIETEINQDLGERNDLWHSRKFKTYWLLWTFSLHYIYESSKSEVNTAS